MPPEDTPASFTKPPRRSHAERRAEGRVLIIEATVQCLCRDGYGATTTDAILKESGVSRGRLLNLFPTKVDLMIAVSRHGWNVSRRHSRDWTHQFENPVDKARNIVDLSWKIMSDPPGVAVLEILVACRSDDVLAQRFVPEHQRVQQAAIDQARSTFAQLGISENVDADAHHRYLEACIRGLVIDRTFDIAGSETPKALDFIKEQLVNLLPSESCSGGVSDAA